MIKNDNSEDMAYSRPIGQNAGGEIRDKNTCQRECGIDTNAYERETVINKNSDQKITSDKKSYALGESITTKKSYQRKEEKGMSENKNLNPDKHVRKKQKGENARNQNSYKDVEKNHTCGKMNQDSHERDSSDKSTHQSKTSDKNSNQIDTSDKNTHKRETFDKNSRQRDTFNKNSNQRDTSDKNASKRETSDKKITQRCDS